MRLGLEKDPSQHAFPSVGGRNETFLSRKRGNAYARDFTGIRAFEI
jgi:hypothetical protein